MNKTLMLVICDFLLLSMLALARFDPPEDAPKPTLDATASSATAEAELIELLEESLQAEQGSRENLSSDLQETRESLAEKAAQLAAREAALAETQANLDKTAAEAQALAKAKVEADATRAELTAEREELAQRVEKTREQLQEASEERLQLANTLGAANEQRSVSEERLRQAEEALLARERELATREAELREANAEKAQLAQEQAELNKALEVAQTERRMLSDNLTREQTNRTLAEDRADRLTDNVAVLGQGVTQLGQGFSQLGQEVTNIAQSSEAMQKEIKDSRPRTMSEIFTRFQKNRATLTFTSREQGVFGGTTTKSYQSRSIMVKGSDENYYLVTHSNNSPFSLSKSKEVESTTLTVSVGDEKIKINQIGFLAADPRIIFIPLPKVLAQNSGLETFELARQPERWEEAVLVKNDESNFGRTEFRRLTSSARFLKMERPTLGELFADFAASRGDLAFTKNSQFIGLLSDTRHAVVIDDLLAVGILELGQGFDPQQARRTIEEMKDRLRQLPEEVR